MILAVLCVLSLAPGCGLLGGSAGVPAPDSRPPTAPDDVDTLAVREPAPPEERDAEPVAAKPSPAPGTPAPDVAPGSQPAEFTVQMSDAERERLRADAVRFAGEAESALESVRLDAVDAGVAEKIDLVRSLLADSYAALDRGDIRAAAALSEKASIIAVALRTEAKQGRAD